MFAALYTLIKTIHAIKATSWPINHFIAEGRKGDRFALQQAIKLDTVAITSPTSIMAAEGISSLDQAYRLYLDRAAEYHRSRQRSGHSLGSYINTKASNKARKFNTRLKPEFKDRDPETYRRTKGGE